MKRRRINAWLNGFMPRVAIAHGSTLPYMDNSWGGSYEFVVVCPATVYVDNMGSVDNSWGRSYEFVVVAYMSTLRHSYGFSVILASLKTSVPRRKSPLFDGHLEI